MQPLSDYYLDESGNTGDLSNVKIDPYFAEQRMFGLAAFGTDLDDDFIRQFGTIKAAHRIQAPEVKAKHAYDKPPFMLELLDLLMARRCPIFIELVDKHYFVVTNIIERMVVPYVGGCDVEPKTLWMKGVMADYMALYAPRDLVHAFTACCLSRDHAAIWELYKAIIRWAQESPVPPQEVAQGIVRFAQDSLKGYRKLPKARAVERALPVPDANPVGKLLWVLPNLTSFTNIYARINHHRGKRVSGGTLFHDEQLQFGDILQQNKKIAESFAELGLKLPLRTADFEFSEAAELKFLRSHESIGIQIADILAGFCTRYVQDVVWSGASRQGDRTVAFDRLVGSANRDRGTGINFVAPDRMLHFLGIAPLPNY